MTTQQTPHGGQVVDPIADSVRWTSINYPLKLVIAGKSWVACDALTYVADLLHISAVEIRIFVLPSASDGQTETWQPSLRQTATQLGLEILDSKRDIARLEADVVISLEYDRLLSKTDLGRARAFNIHFSNLPKYRGCGTSVWPLRNGETMAGVTLHEITPGIDDGPIVAQRHFSIPTFLTAFELYRLYNNHAFDLFKDQFDTILRGSYKLTEQDHEIATLYMRNDLDFRQVEIDMFHLHADQVRDFARSLMFPPYQLPTYKGKSVYRVDVINTVNGHDHHQIGFEIHAVSRVIVKCAECWVRLFFEPI
ncbi:MAG TPA: hypothetical protein DCZ59_05995 [Bacteroidetes bacterium]|nr:hypothetical protein [Bacteroidota bacterium]